MLLVGLSNDVHRNFAGFTKTLEQIPGVNHVSDRYTEMPFHVTAAFHPPLIALNVLTEYREWHKCLLLPLEEGYQVESQNCLNIRG